MAHASEWFGRLLRLPGEERRILVQTTKAAIAAVGAWLLAADVFGLAQPFLAPYAAIFLIETTVYRSIWSWAQQVGAVTVGVFLAAAAGSWIPSTAAGIGVVVLVGLLVGSSRWFGDAGIWIGITGMLLLSYGTATQGGLLADRLLEMALGAGLGTAVNALIFPPLHGERARRATYHLGHEVAELLRVLAEVVRGHDGGDWLQRARDMESLVRSAESALDQSWESRRFNVRWWRPRSRGREKWFEPTLAAMRSAWPHLSQIVAMVRAATEHDDGSVSTEGDEDAAAVLDALADVVSLRLDPGCSPGRLDKDLQQARDHIDRLATTHTEFGVLVRPARDVVHWLTP